MSKHLRFGKLLGMLAIMLTLSLAWNSVSAQNLSSAKQLLTFSFANSANGGAQLGGDVTGVINQTSRTVALTVPYQTDVTGLIASFTSSPFSNVFGDVAAPPFGAAAVSGVSPALNYTSPVTWTVEAENHSYENYVVTVTKAAASSARELTSFSGAWTKGWSGCGTHGALSGTAAGNFSGTNVSISVPYGANLKTITVTLSVSPYASCAPASGASVDFDTNNDGIPNAVTFTVTAQNSTTQNYTVLPVVGSISLANNLLGMSVPGSLSVVMNPAGKTVSIVMPYSASSWSPDFQVSDWAHTYSSLAPDVNWCQFAAVALDGNKLTADSYNLWIKAEQTSEVSLWTISVSNAAVSTAKELTGATGSYTKTWGHAGCLQTETVTGLVGSISGTTVTFMVPAGVTGITLTATTQSALATRTTPAALPAFITPGAGPEIVITAEDASFKNYDVVLVNDPISNLKQMLTFGITVGGTDYPYTTLDQNLKRILVTVPPFTDLHTLVAYFTSSKYSSVFIAESNGSYTEQCSRVTVNDHSNTLTYVVRAADGTEERYEVTVVKENALTGNDLIGFKLTGRPYCIGGTFEVNGTYTGTNIAVSVKNGTNLTSLAYSFTLSPGATVSGPASPANFTSPVTFTVTSQAGVAKTYTVTVTPRAVNSEKKLLTYKFAAANNPALGGNDVAGTINETTKTVEVWIPWDARTGIANLVASFTLSTNALMTHSEDPLNTDIRQYTGVTPNDFTTPVAYTVWAENCSTVEYFVIVNVIPNTETGISAFTFASSGCGCGLVNRIDPYARRIYITLPYTMDISNLAPSSVVVTPGASVVVANTNPAQSWSTAKDWTKGPVVYTVTAPDGVTKANWTVMVSNPACKETDITSWSFATGQVGSATINKDAHTVNIIIANGTNLRNMSATIGFSCGASICCNLGACAGTTIDFSDNMCHTCVITAQDESITQDWTICLTYEDTDVPLVTTWSVMAYNCTDSAAVQSNELGYVFLLHESAINFSTLPYPTPNYAINTAAGRTAMVNAHMGAYAAVDSANYPKYVQINNLYSGVYWAFAVDPSGNISCVSAQKLFLDICEVDVADLCALRAAVPVYRFRVTGEVFVSYEETRPGGNWKFVQDASCGILVEDLLGALPVTYGAGAGLTNLVGTLSTDYTGRNMTLNPVCCYTPTKSSTGNVINPIMMTYDEFYASAYTGSHVYESMLVRITTPMKAFDDYGLGYLTWEFDQLDLATTNASGAYDWFITKDFNNTDYIGVAIPTAPTIYQGIRRNVNWGSTYGLITPRKKADIIKVTGSDVIADPNPAEINGVLPGQCGTVMIDIINQGVDPATVTAVYLDDSPGTDEFNIVNPTSVPWPALASWANHAVQVDFCPLDAGNETTNLIVEYGIGKVLVVPINGTTLVAYPMPYYQTFNCLAAPNNEWCNTNMNVNSARHGWSGTYTGSAETMIYSGWGDQFDGNTLHMRVRQVIGGVRQPVVVETPGFIVTGSDPIVSFMEAQMAAYKSATNNDMRTLSISTDKVTWTQIYATTSANVPTDLDGYRKIVLSLAPYTGQTVFFRFDMAAQPSNAYNYYNIDNFFVEQRVTAPIIAATPNPGEYGGVQVGESSSLNFSVKNTGISVLKVKKVEVVGTGFALTDTNTYPFEVNASGGYAYSVGSNGATLNFAVAFKPTEVGVKTGKVVVTYGLYSDMTYEIPLTGEGLSCYTAAEAHIGENHFFQNSWFKYTAEAFQLVNINSCHANNTTDPYVYSYDTWIYVYADCEGTLLAENDDLEWAACPFNRAASGVNLVMNEGETVYIFWPLAFAGSAHAYDEMIFNIVPNYPVAGDVCETAIPLTLPVVNMFGSTKKFADDYNASPCSPFSNYMDGNDVVYTITLPYDGYLTGSILGAYGAIHVLDKCPKEVLTADACKAYTGGPMGGQFEKRIQGGTYYVIISTWAPPQTVDFLLNLRFRGTGVDDNALMGNLSVFPNPTNGKFTVSVSNAEASDMTIELVNISGQVVYRNNVKAAYSYTEEIDASEFAKGVYYLKVNDGNGVKIEKVVVQ